MQIAILAVLAIANCCVIAGLGVLATGMLDATPAPTTEAPAGGGVNAPAPAGTPAGGVAAATPVPTAPPTWTPDPTPTPLGMERLNTFVPGHCPFRVPRSVHIECGTLILPENRADLSAGFVHLAVAIYHSYSESPAPDPIVYLNGGPGGDSVESMINLYESFIDPLLEERDVIVFDQRGTGLSRPNLDCPEYEAVTKKDLEELFSPDEKAEEYPRAMRRCRDRLTALGIDLAAYTSAANAADVRDLIRVLGYEQANLYGASYGTRLALTVMRDHPEVVRSAVLDAVEPIEVPMYNGHAASVDRLLGKIFDGCAADPACRSAYPDLEGSYYGLIERLRSSPVEVWTRSPGDKMYRIQMTDYVFTAGIFFGSYSTDVLPYIPQIIDDTYNGNYDLLSWLLGFGLRMEKGISTGMMLSVNCHEETFATTPEQLAADYAAYPHVAYFSNASIYGAPETLFTICREWGAAPFDPREGEGVASDVPTLVLVGGYDPITPPYYALQAADRLDRSYFYEFPGQGHVVGMGDHPCPAGIVRDFIRDPHAPPSAGCIDAMPAPAFLP